MTCQRIIQIIAHANVIPTNRAVFLTWLLTCIQLASTSSSVSIVSNWLIGRCSKSGNLCTTSLITVMADVTVYGIDGYVQNELPCMGFHPADEVLSNDVAVNPLLKEVKSCNNISPWQHVWHYCQDFEPCSPSISTRKVRQCRSEEQISQVQILGNKSWSL